MMDSDILAYTAGIIDGEGTIGTRGPWFTVVVEVQNTNDELIETLHNWYGGVAVYDQLRKNNRGKRKPFHYWRLNKSATISEFLRSIEPHLRLKKAHANLALTILATSRADRSLRQVRVNDIIMSVRSEAAASLTKLNKRGV